MNSMQGQKVVVMGGTSGMGLAAAKEFASLGADVIITGRDPERAVRAAGEAGVRAEIVDAASEESLRDFFDMVRNNRSPGDHFKRRPRRGALPRSLG